MPLFINETPITEVWVRRGSNPPEEMTEVRLANGTVVFQKAQDSDWVEAVRGLLNRTSSGDISKITLNTSSYGTVSSKLIIIENMTVGYATFNINLDNPYTVIVCRRLTESGGGMPAVQNLNNMQIAAGMVWVVRSTSLNKMVFKMPLSSQSSVYNNSEIDSIASRLEEINPSRTVIPANNLANIPATAPLVRYTDNQIVMVPTGRQFEVFLEKSGTDMVTIVSGGQSVNIDGSIWRDFGQGGLALLSRTASGATILTNTSRNVGLS